MSAWLEGHPGLPRLLAGLDDSGAPMTLAQHAAVHGTLPPVHPHELIEAVQASGLRGRGGADFPTARKLQAVAGRRGVSAVVVNGSETEPASQKDRLLLSRLPHLVLDGAVLAADAVGAREVIVQIGDAARGSLDALQGAVAMRPDDPVSVQIVTAPQGYVAGEESAVVNYLNRGVLLPTFVPPRPFERGYRGRPTLIQNPETLAQVALVARFGERWYRELGTATDPGSALVTVSGAVEVPGVYELAFGTRLDDLLEAAGGPTESLRALLVGGYFGTWVDADVAHALRLAREDLRGVGAALGSGVIIALGQSSCGLHESARVIDYLAGQSVRQCGPCTHGLRAIADSTGALASGTAQAGEHERLLRWAAEVRGRGACHHPDGAARFVVSALNVFAPEIESHRRGRCTAAPAGFPVA
ncbi:MAG TPA: NADH-ubiquinone oxidoreductase-F iron-sulfur binding region domain-containing protein [Streptosporangiaceae bacterium]|jgi:NADH:ubiquinone oxidoreductase subunit F (NADH-binding)|nr:NADH-ubiquinone oxidoreductase-F iron-sulfur binding region domain-containing protein [Streptosporangiaceae bacterium]